jgi:hypothetical protein
VGEPSVDSVYAAPATAPPATRGKTSSALVIGGLAWYGAIELASDPLAWAAVVQLDHAVSLNVGVGGDAAAYGKALALYHDIGATFFLARAAADVGLVIAFFCGLFWLHRIWTATKPGAKPGWTANAVVLWAVVPVWGVFRISQCLRFIASAIRVPQDKLPIGMWVLAVLTHVGIRLATSSQLGWPAIVDSMVAAWASGLGILIVLRLQRGFEARPAAAAVG